MKSNKDIHRWIREVNEEEEGNDNQIDFMNDFVFVIVACQIIMFNQSVTSSI